MKTHTRPVAGPPAAVCLEIRGIIAALIEPVTIRDFLIDCTSDTKDALGRQGADHIVPVNMIGFAKEAALAGQTALDEFCEHPKCISTTSSCPRAESADGPQCVYVAFCFTAR